MNIRHIKSHVPSYPTAVSTYPTVVPSYPMFQVTPWYPTPNPSNLYIYHASVAWYFARTLNIYLNINVFIDTVSYNRFWNRFHIALGATKSVRTSGTNFAPYFLVSSRGKFDQVHVLHLKIVSPQMHCLAVDCGTFSPCLQARDTVHVFPAST